MKLIHRKDLKYNSKISHSLISPIIGSIFIGGWGVGIYFMINEGFPLPVLLMQYIFWPVFAFILIKQWIGVLESQNFFMAFDSNGVILPLNYSIKTPDEDRDYYLYINLSKDVKDIEIINESRRFKIMEHRTQNTKIENMKYLCFDLREEIPLDIYKKHLDIATDQGFTGSPVVLKPNRVEFSMAYNLMSLAKVSKRFIKTGFYSGKQAKRNVSISDNSSYQEIKENLVFLSQLGKTMDVEKALIYLEKKEQLSPAELSKLRSNPKVRCFKKKS